VRRLVRERLGAASVPEWVNEITVMPRIAGGKPDLRAIDEWLDRLRASFREVQSGSGLLLSQQSPSPGSPSPEPPSHEAPSAPPRPRQPDPQSQHPQHPADREETQ
jgi:hypothetical protein